MKKILVSLICLVFFSNVTVFATEREERKANSMLEKFQQTSKVEDFNEALDYYIKLSSKYNEPLVTGALDSGAVLNFNKYNATKQKKYKNKARKYINLAMQNNTKNPDTLVYGIALAVDDLNADEMSRCYNYMCKVSPDDCLKIKEVFSNGVVQVKQMKSAQGKMYRIGKAIGTLDRTTKNATRKLNNVVGKPFIQGVVAGGVAGVLTKNPLFGLNVGYQYANLKAMQKYADNSKVNTKAAASDRKQVTYGYNAAGNYVRTSVGDDQIQYGYNAVGEYVPISIGSAKINYGYNAAGKYVPTSIGDSQIQYEYNARGNYAPSSIGGQRIEYGFNAVGDYVPVSIGGRTIQYGYNAQGQYVPVSY